MGPICVVRIDGSTDDACSGESPGGRFVGVGVGVGVVGVVGVGSVGLGGSTDLSVFGDGFLLSVTIFGASWYLLTCLENSSLS